MARVITQSLPFGRRPSSSLLPGTGTSSAPVSAPITGFTFHLQLGAARVLLARGYSVPDHRADCLARLVLAGAPTAALRRVSDVLPASAVRALRGVYGLIARRLATGGILSLLIHVGKTSTGSARFRSPLASARAVS